MPDFHQGALVAHACRAMLTLDDQFERLDASIVVGYRIDLKLPPDGNATFWDLYGAFTSCFRSDWLRDVTPLIFGTSSTGLDRSDAQLDQQGGSLIELLALQQSRD